MFALCSQDDLGGAALARRALEQLVVAEPQVERRMPRSWRPTWSASAG
jgi:hypothetical protein